MGHLKRIGKKQCCDDCTPGKCDDCGPCVVFNVASFCITDTFSLSKSGWTDYVAPEFYEPNQDANGGCIADGSTFSPTDGGGPELDECRRWRKRTFSSWTDHCGRVDTDDPFDCQRWTVEESVHDLDKLTPPENSSYTRRPLQASSNFWSGGQYDNNFTTVETDTSGEVVGCCDPATPQTPGTTNRARVRGAHDIIEYNRALFVAASCPVVQLLSGDGMGYESLSSPVQTEDLLSDLMDAEFAECARENCIVDTVENKAARLALTGLDSGDVVIQTRDEEDEEYCGDGMHFRFLGGAEDDEENWEPLGLYFLCPYVLPKDPLGCLMRGSIAASWFWLEGGAGWNCPSLGESAGSKGNVTLGPQPGVAHIASFSVALRDMTPGTSYRLTLKYRSCEIGHHVDVTPDCEGPHNPGCVVEAEEEDDREWETVERTMEFEATDWGEIIALDCDELAVRIKKCQLQKIADELNSVEELGEEDEGYRTVACSAPVEPSMLRIPVEVDTYYVLLSCDLEEIVEL